MMKDKMLDATQKSTYGEIFVKPYKAMPIADDPDDGTINDGNPNTLEPSKYVPIRDEEETRDSSDETLKIYTIERNPIS